MKIRNGFVSNSSSSSFVVTKSKGCFEKKRELNKYIIGKNGETEFGWNRSPYYDSDSKINFSWLQANYIKDNCPEHMEMLMSVLEEWFNCKEIESIIENNWKTEEGKVYGYIDHQSASYEGENLEIFDSRKNLINFLFNNESFLVTDNDNY